MTARPARQDYLDIVDHRRTDRHLFAPLADGLFAAGWTGKPWVSDVTLDDQIAAADASGYAASFVTGSTPDLSTNTGLDVETVRTQDTPEERRFRQTIRTPHGELTRELVEQPAEGIAPVGEFVSDVAQLDAADWIAEQVLAGARDAAVSETYSQWVARTRDFGVTQVQLELPFFLLTLTGFADKPVLMHMMEPERFARSMALAERALHHLAKLLIDAGVDFIWVGAPGTELLSPTIFEEVIIPQAWRMADRVQSLGGRLHFHCCGHSRLWIEKGYFNEIGMDVLETLSPPPAGTVEDLAAARAAIDAKIVTRGNIDLELLRTGTPDQCADAARAVFAATTGYPHLLGAADALLYGTPVENLHAVNAVCAEG